MLVVEKALNSLIILVAVESLTKTPDVSRSLLACVSPLIVEIQGII